MDEALIQQALKAAQQSKRYAIATVVESTLKGTPRKSGAKMIVLEDGALFGTIGGGRNEKAAHRECLKAIKTGQPQLITYDFFGGRGQSVCGGQFKVFIEPVSAAKHLIICGAGHIALPLSALGKILNFKVTIIDSRHAYANKKRFPHVDKIIVGKHAEKLKNQSINEHTYVMIVTHGNEHDYQCLKAVIKSKAAYIGVISSKAKKIKFFNRLKKANVDSKFLKRIDIPAGVDVGAQTPAEIATSIAAQITKILNKNKLKTAKFR